MLVAFTALTRFAFRSHYLYDLDSVNFALALKRFDPSTHQPHPPGYFLYVYLGRLANLIFHDANAAFVAISVLFSCGAVVMIYVLAENWFGGNAGLFAGLIFVFSPLAWFHGTVALTYIVEAFFSAVTGYFCWHIYRGAARFIPFGALVTGIAAGFRPSSVLFLGPLLIFSLRGVTRRQAAAGGGALLLTLLAWFIPMIQSAGGTVYLSSLLSLWVTVPSKGMVFNSPIANSLARIAVIVEIYFLCFGCAAVLPLTGNHLAMDRRKAIFTTVWITPGLLFFAFIYLKFVNSGYLLVLFPPVCVWMGGLASDWYASARFSRAVMILAMGGCAAANTAAFLYLPLYCSYREVRRFEKELETIVETLPELASPEDTMIVAFDSHFLGYRHAGYYLPRYLTVQYPEVPLSSGKRVFAMRDRDTWLESRLPPASIRNFILFPLPLGDGEYSDYIAKVRKRLRPEELRIVRRGGHEFAIGPAGDLPLLFPVSASSQNGLRGDAPLTPR